MAEIKWFGQGCFRVRAREAMVLLDPVGKSTGYVMPRQKADIVTLSHQHPGNAALSQVQDGYFLIDGPGEYEVSDILVTGIRAFRDDNLGKERGYNTIYLLELEEMRICHLGALGHVLTESQIERLEAVDILMVPIGGGDALDAQAANEVIAQIQPRIVIPMHYRAANGSSGLDDIAQFCKTLGVENPMPQEKLTIRKSELPETVGVVILEP